MDFLVGQVVRWASQSRGNWTTKQGIICQIVAPGLKPDLRYRNLHSGAGTGASRDHESYVVSADGKFYWPRVDGLKPVVHEPDKTVPAENFMRTIAANVCNPELDDAAFRSFVRNTLPIVKY